jgi:hypothetical protein
VDVLEADESFLSDDFLSPESFFSELELDDPEESLDELEPESELDESPEVDDDDDFDFDEARLSVL